MANALLVVKVMVFRPALTVWGTLNTVPSFSFLPRQHLVFQVAVAKNARKINLLTTDMGMNLP